MVLRVTISCNQLLTDIQSIIKKLFFSGFVRGGGHPGSMLMKDNNNNQFKVSYKDYGGYSGYTKILRCHLCVDATGELADISLGDRGWENI